MPKVDILMGDLEMTEYKSLPVSGYKPQSSASVNIVNENKEIEERMLRQLDRLETTTAINGEDISIDARWLAIGRTQLEQAFMAINRAIFQPSRVVLAGDEGAPKLGGDKLEDAGG